MEIRLSSPVTDFPGVGEVRGAKLAKLGLGTADLGLDRIYRYIQGI